MEMDRGVGEHEPLWAKTCRLSTPPCPVSLAAFYVSAIFLSLPLACPRTLSFAHTHPLFCTHTMSGSPSSDAKRQKTSHSTEAPLEIPSTPPEERPSSPKKVLILFLYFSTVGVISGDDATSLVEVTLPEGIKPEKEVRLHSELDIGADTEKSVIFWELVRLSINREWPEYYQYFAKHIPEGFLEAAVAARKIPNEGPGMPATDGSVMYTSYV